MRGDRASRSALLILIVSIVIASCGGQGAQSQAVPALTVSPVPAGPNVIDAGLSGQWGGWVVTRHGLLLSRDNGAHWAHITPPAVDGSAIKAVSFVDGQRGYVLATTGLTAEGVNRRGLTVYSTKDGGRSWAATAINAANPVYGTYGPSTFALLAGDNSVGWLGVDLGTNANFSHSEIFRTDNAGASWRAISTSVPRGALHFDNVNDGWLATSARVYATSDGGSTWSSVQIPAPPGFAAHVSQQIYSEQSDTGGVVSVLYRASDGNSALAFYTEANGSFTLATLLPFGASAGAAMPVVAIADARTIAVVQNVNHTSAALSISTDGGTAWTKVSKSGLPSGVQHLQFRGSTAWALVNVSGCLGVKSSCYSVNQLFVSSDSGRTWIRAHPS